MKLLTTILLLAILVTPGVAGQDVTYDRYLLPVFVPRPTDGAYGSRWETEVVISNTGSNAVHIGNLSWPCNLICFDVALPAGVSIPLVFRSLTETSIPSRFLEIERGARDVSVQLRVRDVARADTNWGTEVPVVRVPEVHRTRVDLTGIPLAAGYRQMLRIYDLSRTTTAVRVHVYDVNPQFREQFLQSPPDRLLATFDLPLFRGAGDQPHYGEYADLAALADASQYDLIRVRIEHLNGTANLWALATVTNNVTQQITNVTPQGPSMEQ
jgi:hypothetical protein